MTLSNFLENNMIAHSIKILLITCFTLGMMTALTSFKYPARKILTLFGFYLVWVFMSSWVIISIFGYFFFTKVMLFTISLPAIALAYKMDCNSPAQSVFNYATQVGFSLIFAMTVLLLNTLLHGNQFTYFLLLIAVYSIVIYLEYRYLRKPFLNLTRTVHIGWGSLSLIPICFCALIELIGNVPFYYIREPIRVVYIYGLLVLMIIVYFVVYQSILRQYQLQMVSHEKELLMLQVSSMEKQAKNILTSEERLKILRHDIRHFSIIMNTCLKDGAMEDAKHLLSGLEDALLKSETPHYCQNYIINSVLTYYLDAAKNEGIQVQADFTVPPKDTIDSTSFSVVLANALDNALVACRNESIERCIKLKSRMNGSQYLMEIANTCSTDIVFDEDGLPISQKGIEHGIGTKSILSFARQTHSSVIFRQEHGQFILQMITNTSLCNQS